MPKTVLLVEDNPDNRLLIHMIFRRFTKDSIKVIDAQDGEEGLKLAFENQPDLILMDLKMPKMDGFEAIVKLRSDPATLEIPIIVLSAQVMDEDTQRALDAGAQGVLSKPIDIAKFSETVRPYIEDTPSV